MYEAFTVLWTCTLDLDLDGHRTAGGIRAIAGTVGGGHQRRWHPIQRQHLRSTEDPRRKARACGHRVQCCRAYLIRGIIQTTKRRALLHYPAESLV